MQYKYIVTAGSGAEAMWMIAQKLQQIQADKNLNDAESPVLSSGLNGSRVSYPQNIAVQDGVIAIDNGDGTTTDVPNMVLGPTWQSVYSMPGKSDADFASAADEVLPD